MKVEKINAVITGGGSGLGEGTARVLKEKGANIFLIDLVKDYEFDFGEIKEMGGKVSHKFVFTNNSKKSIQILTVKPSCGCTTPDWSKKEIKPGKDGFIVAEYNPRGRPGVFRKSLSVVTSDNKRSVIFIKGKVSR